MRAQNQAEAGGPVRVVEPAMRAALLLPAAVAVAVLDQLGRPFPAFWPRRDPDVSWMVGLQLMRDYGVPFGYDGAFTYGPGGFLTAPTGIDLSDLVLAGVFRALAVALLFMSVYALLPHRGWSLIVAATTTLLMGNSNQAGWMLMLALTAVALGLLASGRPVSCQLVTGFGLASALSLQIKVSEGILSVALLGLVVLASRRPRVWLAAGGAFLGGFVVLWLAAGQALQNVPGWLDLGSHIVSGYGEAMAYPTSNPFKWLMVLGGVLCVGAVLIARSLPLPARLGALGVVLFVEKAALTRADAAHLLPGYSGLLLVVIVAAVAGLPRGARIVLFPVAGAMALLMTVNLPLLPPRHLSAEAWPIDVLPGENARRLAAAKDALVAELGIAPSVLQSLDGHPISIDPWEISVAWAYDMDWHPLPVFQHYSAYTRRLDEANAAAVMSDPDHRVLREKAAYDDGLQHWESPSYSLALLCHFEQIAGAGEWSVFARTVDRCSQPVRLSNVRVSAGKATDLPAPEGAVIAVRFEPDSRGLADRLWGTIGVQRNLLHATVDGATYRVPEQLAGGPLIVGAPSGEPVLFDLESAKRISFDRGGELEVIEIPLLGRESE